MRFSSRIGILGFFLFLLALLSKTTASVVPAVLLVLLWWRAGRVKRADVAALVPWFAAGAFLGAHTAWLERTHVAARGSELSLRVAERVVLAGRVVLFYSKKFFLPIDLAFIYTREPLDARAVLQWLPAAALLALAAARGSCAAASDAGPSRPSSCTSASSSPRSAS